MLLDWFTRGGWVMWPILAASIVAFAVVLDRVRFALRLRGASAGLQAEALRLVDAGRPAEARLVCERAHHPVAAVMSAGLSAWGLPQEEVERRLEQSAADQLALAEERLPLLASMLAVLPMLGFLGTIIGLIGAFAEWARAGAQVQVEQLAQGIFQAMITTAAGLIGAIPYLLAYNFFAAMAARLARSMNSAASDLAGRHRNPEAAHATHPALAAAPAPGGPK